MQQILSHDGQRSLGAKWKDQRVTTAWSPWAKRIAGGGAADHAPYRMSPLLSLDERTFLDPYSTTDQEMIVIGNSL